MNKKQSLQRQRPSEKLLAAQRGEVPAMPARPVTFHMMAEILTLSHYNASALRDGCRVGMAEVKESLGYESAPALERLLIDQIALSWLRVGEAEAMYSQITSGTHTSDKAEYVEKRLTACVKRYTHLCEALSRIQRNIIPAVQVNIAGQQIVMGAK